MSDRLIEYLKSDRQWTRRCRIAHAKYQKSAATTDDDRHFWQLVIEANTLHKETPR